MSAANAKNKKTNQPALATTGRGAAFAITMGITLITLAFAWLLSLLSGSDSYVLSEMRKALQGLCGPLCPILPLLLLWGGVKLMVSSRHRVAIRDIVLVSCLYLLVLTGYTLTARVQQNVEVLSYMDFVGKQNYKTMTTGYDSFTAYLHQAYSLRTSGAGGLIGMLLAYPLWKLLGMLVGVLTVVALFIVAIFLLFRLNPGDLFRSASEKGEQSRIRREQKRHKRPRRKLPARQKWPGRSSPRPISNGLWRNCSPVKRWPGRKAFISKRPLIITSPRPFMIPRLPRLPRIATARKNRASIPCAPICMMSASPCMITAERKSRKKRILCSPKRRRISPPNPLRMMIFILPWISLPPPYRRFTGRMIPGSPLLLNPNPNRKSRKNILKSPRLPLPSCL